MAHILDANGNPIASSEESTTTATETEPSRQKTYKDDILFIQTPIFILFAEYLGYVSLLTQFAEDWCNPNKPMPKECIQTLLDREARSIYDEMLKEWSEDEINKLYKNFFQCGLDELESDLNEKNKAHGSDLPF